MRSIFNVIVFLIAFCSCDGVSRNDLKAQLKKNKDGFEAIAQKFLKQKSIKWISIYADYDNNLCQSINDWSNCPSHSKKWESWDDSLKTEIYLSTRDEVLKRCNIKSEDYKYYFDFLKKHDLGQISIVFDCYGCVEFESKLNGLRYVADKETLLREDDEYLTVERVENNWFVYSRDWN
jgi:hypothetical protein